MSQPAVSQHSSLLDALERALGPGGVAQLDPTVPTAAWRVALAGPAAEFLARGGKQLRAAMVEAGWMLAGGAPGQLPEGLVLVLELLHAGSLIVDDVEDGSATRRGAPALHVLVGEPLAINTGSWMYFWALGELARAGLPPALELEAYRATINALIRCHHGQALDLAIEIGNLDVPDAIRVVETTTRLKTGALCRLATELGAIAAGASPVVRAAIASFGESAGIALQMLDDLGAVTSRRDKGLEDVRAGRPTWPWVWLVETGPFGWARLIADARAVAAGTGDAGALVDALAAAVEPVGRARIRAAIADTVASLRAALGDSPAVDAVAATLARMEDSYG